MRKHPASFFTWASGRSAARASLNLAAAWM